MINLKDFFATGDGVTDDTLAINNAISESVLCKEKLYIPSGIYLTSRIVAKSGMVLEGEDDKLTIIKQIANSTSGIISSPNNFIDDVTISNITFDGNSANGTSGDTITVYGSRPVLKDINVINSPANAIVTNCSLSQGERLTGCDGFFSRITIDKTQKSGWLHYGPSDSHFESVFIIDAGLQANNTYYGIFLGGASGNARFFNLHPWNRSSATNVPRAAVHVQSSGNTFTGCHIEGGMNALVIQGNGNVFGDCAFYAPRGKYTVQILGICNKLNGVLGVGAASANTAYKGVLLSSQNNTLDLTNLGSGCTLGAIDFTNDNGQNFVKLNGYQATGVVTVGTPHPTDNVLIAVSGSPGKTFRQHYP